MVAHKFCYLLLPVLSILLVPQNLLATGCRICGGSLVRGAYGTYCPYCNPPTVYQPPPNNNPAPFYYWFQGGSGGTLGFIPMQFIATERSLGRKSEEDLGTDEWWKNACMEDFQNSWSEGDSGYSSTSGYCTGGGAEELDCNNADASEAVPGGVETALVPYASSILASLDAVNVKLQSMASRLGEPGKKAFKGYFEHTLRSFKDDSIDRLLVMANRLPETSVVALVYFPQTHELLVILGTQNTGLQFVRVINNQTGSATTLGLNMSLSLLLQVVLSSHRFRLFIKSEEHFPKREKKEP